MAHFKYLFFTLLFGITSVCVIAQNNHIKGKVVDASSKEPLAFVNILINEGPYGSSTDIDGRFFIKTDEVPERLYFSYVGYKPEEVHLGRVRKPLIINMEPKEIELSAVEITPDMNPANRIIEAAIANRKKNNPKNLHAYRYNSYDKMIFTINQDSLAKIKANENDTSIINMKKFFDKQHLFLMETSSEVKYQKPGKIDEKVTASRISGLKDPLFVFLISQMQSTSFYDDLIRISDKHYVNPVSKGSLNKYHYHLEDTILKTGTSDTSFVITYRPLKNKNFDALQGLLHINTRGYAIENVIAEPARKEGGISMKIRQKYKLIDKQHWFPVQLRTHFVLNNVRVGPFSPEGQGTSYISNIEINPEFPRKTFDNIVVDAEQDAFEQPESYWDDLRVHELSRKEQETYRVIDSIGEVHNLDRKLQSFSILAKGKLPLGKLSLNIDDMVHYNDYEGWYLGLGGNTNRRFSKTLTLGGHWGYGFKDKATKWGAHLDLMLYKPWDARLTLSYSDDLTESAAISTFEDNEIVQDTWFRNYLVNQFNRTESMEAGFEFRWLQYMNTNVSIKKENHNPLYDYSFGSETHKVENNSTYTFANVSAGLRFAYGEQFIRNGDSKMSLGTDYPVVWFQYSRSISGWLNGMYTMNRYDLQVDYKHYFRLFGETSVQLNAGFIDGNIPATNLYNGHGSYRKFSLFAPSSFATMRMNEFLSDRFAALFVSHNFGKLLMRTDHFAPKVVITTNMGFGKLDNHTNHFFDKRPKTMEKGYFESGLLLNNLVGSGFTGIGFGAFYRYGPHHLDKLTDNLTVKLSLSLML